ncbi:E2/E3 hybrid ubiquitin-protein ligase ube2o, partial [Nowakowskiella sp. JEL0078]
MRKLEWNYYLCRVRPFKTGTTFRPDTLINPNSIFYPGRFHPGLSVFGPKDHFSPELWIRGNDEFIPKDAVNVKGEVHSIIPHMLNVEWLLFNSLEENTSEEKPEMSISASKVTPLNSHFESMGFQIGDHVFVENGSELLEETSFNVSGTPVDADLCFKVNQTSTFVDVEWQDGTISRNLIAKDLFPVIHIDDHNLWPKDLVVFVGEEDDNRTEILKDRVGMVLRVDAKERVATVKWFDKNMHRLEGREEEFSLYELTSPEDLSFGLCKKVIITPPQSSQTSEISRNEWFCEIISVNNDGTFCLKSLHTGRMFSISAQRLVLVQEDGEEAGNYSDWEGESDDDSWDTISSNQEDEIINKPENVIDLSIPIELNVEQDLLSDAVAMNTEKVVDPVADNIEKFSVLDEAPTDHKFLSNLGVGPSQQRIVMKEHSLLQRSLPDGIFVRTFANRMDLFRVLMQGPEDTP